jgi:nucleoside-diphosphate-sugar epimerase
MDAFGSFYAKKILITGGLGFIGSNLARALADRGSRITVVDSLIPEYGGNPFNLDDYEDRIKVMLLISDSFSMAYLVQGQDYWFNLGTDDYIDSMKDSFVDSTLTAA